MNHGDDFDDRNRCMRAFIQLIAEAKPMYFVMEQVTEILTEEDKDKPGRFLIDSVRRDAFEGKISMVLYPHNIHTHTHIVSSIFAQFPASQCFAPALPTYMHIGVVLDPRLL